MQWGSCIVWKQKSINLHETDLLFFCKDFHLWIRHLKQFINGLFHEASVHLELYLLDVGKIHFCGHMVTDLRIMFQKFFQDATWACSAAQEWDHAINGIWDNIFIFVGIFPSLTSSASSFSFLLYRFLHSFFSPTFLLFFNPLLDRFLIFHHPLLLIFFLLWRLAEFIWNKR